MLNNFQKIVPDICAFLFGVGIAWSYGWQTTDLIWSLWLGSFVLGYVTILSTIIAGIYIHRKVSQHPGASSETLQSGMNAGVPLALFLLFSFTFHFGGFHVVHAMLLRIFFPIDGPDSISVVSSIDPLGLFTDIVYKVIPFYGLLMLIIIAIDATTPNTKNNQQNSPSQNWIFLFVRRIVSNLAVSRNKTLFVYSVVRSQR